MQINPEIKAQLDELLIKSLKQFYKKMAFKTSTKLY